MAKKNDRIVSQNSNGDWANKKVNATRATSLHKTQGAAEKAAKADLKKQGGGELIVKGENGRIRSKDTIAPGRDPFPPRDKEH
jgi:hypothetical protein